MSKKKLEERKKKAKEAKSKERVLRRRKAIRAEAKKHKEWSLAEKKATKGIPIKGSVADRDAMILEKLRHNYAILEALNEEWEKEQANKKELNQSLEAEGYKTMAEKLDYIGKNAQEQLGIQEELEAAKAEFDSVDYVEVDDTTPDTSGDCCGDCSCGGNE
jgi:hypothetical protein